MAARAALLTVHGMGVTPSNYNEDLKQELKERLGPLYDHLYVGSVYYQSILKENENRVWQRVGCRVRWDTLRQFVLFGFADAAGLETYKNIINSDYRQAQIIIAKELLAARQAMGGSGPVIVIAQSLGCQVISCYFWDAMQATLCQQPSQDGVKCDKPCAGIWKNIDAAGLEITGGRELTAEEIDFLSGKYFRSFITTGCNIPIFVAAHAKEQILPIIPNSMFRWDNFYDQDDVLGWPMADLSDEYAKVVNDHEINAAGGFIGWVMKSWNPMSHTQYWSDNQVLDPLVKMLTMLLI